MRGAKAMVMLRRATLVALAGLTLAGCSNGGRLLDGREAYDGIYFRARLSADREDRDSFVVTVQSARQSLEGAREAGRHKAVQHCIERFGNSYIDWAQGPDVEDGELVFDGETLVFAGRCRGW